jgi:hypothetical protein
MIIKYILGSQLPSKEDKRLVSIRVRMKTHLHQSLWEE